jgi:peptide/nickel transport system permease protein
VLGFVVRKLAGAAATLFVTALVAFTIFRLLPGDVAAVIAGQGATRGQIDQIRESLGLSDGFIPQFLRWLQNAVLHGNLGESAVTGDSVTTLLAQRVPVTLELIATSMIVALATAIPLSLGALWPRSLLDRLGDLWAIVMLSIPVFWLAELLVLAFSLKLGLLPPSGFVDFFEGPLGSLRFFLLPSIAFGFYLSSFLLQFLKPALLDVMTEDYIRTARAKGLSERSIVLRHALQPTMIPFITQLGILLGTSVGATIVVEAVFQYPGFGSLFVQAVVQRDFYVVEASILVIVGAVVVVNLVVDLMYGVLDPRVRTTGDRV